MSFRQVITTAVFVAVATAGFSPVQAQEGDRLRASRPPSVRFEQVRVAKWRANAEEPTITILSQRIKHEVKTRAVVVTRMVAERQVRVIEKDGKKVEQLVTVMKPVKETITQSYTVAVPSDEIQLSHKKADKVQVWDLNGKKIDPAKFKELFKKSRHVFVLHQPWEKNPPVDAFYKSVLREDVLFLHVDEPVVRGKAVAVPVPARVPAVRLKPAQIR